MIKIYTKTKHHKVKNSYIAEMYGVIEGPIHDMLKTFPDEFKFVRHESKRSLRAKSQSNEKINPPKS